MERKFDMITLRFEEVMNIMDRQETLIASLHDGPSRRDKRDVKLQKR
jgi:hypothetical protein